MPKIPLPAVFTLLFLLQAFPTSAWIPFTSYQGFDIFDIYGPSVNDMTQLAASWTVINPAGPTKVSSCGIPYIGGPGVMNKNSAFKKTYTNLPTHNIIYYTLSIYTLDGWTASDSFSIQFDGVTVFNYFPSVAQTKLATGTLCVASGYDLYNPYSGTVSHSATSLTFQITVNIVSNSAQPAYFGFRDLQFSFRNDSTGIAQKTNILTADSTVPSASTCASGSFRNTSSNTCVGCTRSANCQGAVSYNCYWGNHHSNTNPDTCVACETDCALCSDSAAGNCVLCTFSKTLDLDGTCKSSCSAGTKLTNGGDASFFVCVSPCAPTNKWTKWDYTCLNSCDFPLVQKDRGIQGLFCQYPCNKATEFLYWNGSCLTTCPFYTRNDGGYRFCDACQPNYFMYPDKTCAATCPIAYNQTTVGGSKFCNPCTSDIYYYANNKTCSGVCQDLFVISYEMAFTYCNFPCPAGQFLYANTSCNSTCQPAFSQRTENSLKFCDYPCTGSQYLYANGSCSYSCQYGFSHRTENSYQFCDYPCNSGEYLYANGSCYSSCQPNFSHRQEDSFDFCDYPCQLSEYLYQNGSCKSACQISFAVRKEGSFQFCDYPCNSGDYLYSNGSCYSSCQPYFNHRQEGSFDFCDYPCPLSWFLYQNGSCKSNCQTGLTVRKEGSFQFCDYVCTAGQYLYKNGSCLSSCQPYFNHRQEGTFDFCDYPCKITSFLYQNGSCASYCQAGFVQRIEKDFKFCDWPCLSGEYRFPNNDTCDTSCFSPFKERIEGSYSFCDEPTAEPELSLEQIKQSSNLARFIKAVRYMIIFGALFLNIYGFDLQSFCLITIFELILYNRYIDVEFSPLFQDVLYRLPAEASFFNLVTDADKKIRQHIDSDSIPYVFEKYGLHSTYLGNHWASLLTIMIALTIVFTIKLVEKITKNPKKSFKVVEYLKSKFLWNILLLLSIENYPGVVIYTSLDLRTTDSDSAWKVISSILCVIINLLGIVVFYISVKIISDYRKSARNTVVPETNTHPHEKKPSVFEKKWKNFSVFYTHFHQTKSLLQQSFIPIFIVRAYLIGLIIAYFFAYPLFQGISLFIINSSMFFYIIIKKPFKAPFEKILHIIQESLILATSFCMLVLASLQEDSYSPRKVFAGIILYSTPIICLMCFLLCISKIIVLLKGSHKPTKKGRPQKVKTSKEPVKNRNTEDHSPDLTSRSLSPNAISPADDLTQNMTSINKLLSSPLKASPSAHVDLSFSQTLSPEKSQRERFSFKIESLKAEVEDLGSSTSIINLQNNKEPSSEVPLIEGGGGAYGRRKRGARKFSKKSTIGLHIVEAEEQENILN